MAYSRVRLRPAKGFLSITIFAAFLLTTVITSGPAEAAEAASPASYSSTNPSVSALPAPPVSAVNEGICLKGYPVVSPKRYVISEKRTLPLVLETSYERMTQILVTHVFQTFLTEILGYDQVQIRYYGDVDDLPLVIERLSYPQELNESIPETMVNLEVWLRQDQNIMDWWPLHSNIIDAGAITSYGRYAWFIPKANGSARGFSDESWRLFTKLQTADKFSFTPSEEKALMTYAKDSEGNFYCTENWCQGGMYVPERCNKTLESSPRCALLLATYANTSRFVYSHINELELYVKVMWVGPNLAKLKDQWTETQARKNKALVLLARAPSDVIVQEDRYHVVSFPPCEEMNSAMSNSSTGCVYDVQRVVKMAWKDLQDAAPTAWEALQAIHFEHSDYRQMINYQEDFFKNGMTINDSIEKAACQWLINNTKKWQDWKQERGKPELIIGGIFPLNSKSYKAEGIVIAAQMAKDAINRNDSLLRDYNISLLVADGQCKADMVMKIFIDYIYDDLYNKLVGVLGPACSDTVEPLAGVSTLYKTVVISYSAEGSTFPDRSKYPYFYRMIGENNQFNQVYLKLLQKIGWKQVASLTEDNQRYTEYLTHLQEFLQTNGINFALNRKFVWNWNATSMGRYLDELKQKNAKIIIGDVYNEAARSLMCEAYLKNMTARHGYVWFLPMWLSPEWYDTDNNRDSLNNVRCTTAEMIEAINGHLSLAHAYYAKDDIVMQEGVTVGEWKEKYKRKCMEQNATPHDYAGFAYDAVWTYAFALDKLMRENQSHVVKIHESATVDQYIKVLNHTYFMGVSGELNFTERSSRSIIRVVQWIKNETRLVGTYYPNSSYPDGPGRLDLTLSAIVWLTPDGKTPSDGTEDPDCLLSFLADSLGISCGAAMTVTNVTFFVCLIIILILGFLKYKRGVDRRMEKVAYTEKYMRDLGLDTLPDSSDLNKWEIPRNRVVLNRKLGEGAFGTVYGGDTDIEGKGWVAVAVKTLKAGSTIEEKLDFLVEVDFMKKFDHNNIVKLIGVCTRSEPIYAVMELMLYGDLKTYLLARRHLVNSEQGGEEADQVSSERLTSMAIDVARALSYLAEMKYVHRDVASRNCMVHGSRVVKLGDFGMTRSLYEKDYYRFSQKAMLPVRWMSPESLSLGCFTPASDVWSYGVLVYEIITFGSFPFQGMGNKEVLKYVQAGNTLNIPTGVKAQLEVFIKSCWNLDYDKRPKASEIVEFLANHPLLLQPCLDEQFSAVQMDDSDQMHVTFADRLKKSSSNCYNRNHPRQPNADLLIDTQEHSAGGSTMNSTVCPTEPLLGSPKNSTPAAKNTTKFVQLGRPASKPTEEYRNNHGPDVMSVL